MSRGMQADARMRHLCCVDTSAHGYSCQGLS